MRMQTPSALLSQVNNEKGRFMNLRNAGAARGVGIWLAALCASCVTVAIASAAPSAPVQMGLASVYSDHLNGKKTASGEPYDSVGLTAAHRTLPLGAEIRVTNLDNGKSVRVRVNDRGPHIDGRIVDLSSRAAAALGVRSGVARVKLEVINQPDHAGADAHSPH
jgi:rare lipoprotein A